MSKFCRNGGIPSDKFPQNGGMDSDADRRAAYCAHCHRDSGTLNLTTQFGFSLDDQLEFPLAAGAEVTESFPLVNTYNCDHTPLIATARDGFTEIVRIPLKAGTYANAIEPSLGAVSLHKAAYNGHAEIQAILVSARRQNVPVLRLRHAAAGGHTLKHFFQG